MAPTFDIDYVFPGVNDGDPVGRRIYEEYCIKTQSYLRLEQFHNERFRDGGLLKYLFRAIETNMPWIRKVHLIVSNKEQVPRGINTDKVHIVLHSDIIPKKHLPTYNSTAIEMFIPFIDDLAEHFIYGNDDMFPFNPTQPSDGYTDNGVPKFQMRTLEAKTIKANQFRMVCSNQGGLLENLVTSKNNNKVFLRPQHGLNPMVKSKCIEAQKLIGLPKIYKSISNFRQAYNYNQYIYMDYMYLIGYYQNSEYTFEYISASNFELLNLIDNTIAQVICINDCASKLNDKQIVQLQVLTAQKFEAKFPNKSKYEKEII